MGYTNQGEEFFLKSMNVEQVFGIIERTDYLQEGKNIHCFDK